MTDLNLDVIGKVRWNDSYVLTEQPNLWGDPPVPFVTTAADYFAGDGAQTVLDLPVGDGRNLPELAERFSTVVGADSSDNAIGIAAGRAAAAGYRNVLLLKADVYATGFADASFDGVFCCDVLGHLQEPARAIRELLRITRPGHHLMANVFALEDSTRGVDMVPIGDETYLFDDRFYFRFYDKSAAKELVDEVEDAADLVALEPVTWTEPPHEGYREYEHEHVSWLFTLRKHT
ncbi:class I SAM-dependent methyltransferase [Actinomadura rubrisoli]|uniref:class I SAM-dependent methyltransferase n=1 Tax=Actinomadura rubrisoli TaxID=2530368 RepID=UPI0014053D35|nr:class I SAM-dependent methyltransferase [Actinomadura rubrisoli]